MLISKKGTLCSIGMDVWRSGAVLPKYSKSRIKETHVVPKRKTQAERGKMKSQPLIYIHTFIMSCKTIYADCLSVLTCFWVCCNEYVIWPGLKMLNVLPVVGEIVSHWDATEIKQFWSRGWICLLKRKEKHTNHVWEWSNHSNFDGAPRNSKTVHQMLRTKKSECL